MTEYEPRRRREVNKFVSARLRQLRRERGLTQTQVGRLLERYSDGKWPVQSVSRAELCEGKNIKRWNVDDLYALAEAFDVSVSYFLPDSDQARVLDDRAAG